jgi:hypothetical protein
VGVGPVVVAFALGAAAVALWIDLRFPKLAPRDLRGIILRAGAALLAGQLIAPVGMHVFVTPESPLLTLFAVFGFAFPALTFALLVVFWTMRSTGEFLGGHLR